MPLIIWFLTDEIFECIMLHLEIRMYFVLWRKSKLRKLKPEKPVLLIKIQKCISLILFIENVWQLLRDYANYLSFEVHTSANYIAVPNILPLPDRITSWLQVGFFCSCTWMSLFLISKEKKTGDLLPFSPSCKAQIKDSERGNKIT